MEPKCVARQYLLNAPEGYMAGVGVRCRNAIAKRLYALHKPADRFIKAAEGVLGRLQGS